jgi:glycerol-3-phosphate dehydrogenase subunit B
MSQTPRYDLAVVGTGLAGMAAAVFASARGLSVVQAGSTGAISYTSGVFDVLGALPAMAEGQPARPVERPFEALAALLRDEPGHPYALLDPEDIRLAFHEVMDFLREAGLPYRAGGETNFLLPTPAGTLKHSWCVPETTLPGCEALAEGTPTCIVAFEGMKGFSARQVAANLGPRWPGLTTARVAMPGHPGGEVYPEQVARMLEVPAARRALAGALAPLVGRARVVGLPAVLGMHRPGDVAADMTRLLGRPVFEIPTMPPGVPGIRLKETFEGLLPGRGVALFCQQKLVGPLPAPGQPFRLRVTGQPVEHEVLADRVLLCSGRFLGGGLGGLRGRRITETVFGLPVAQPEDRADWYRQDYLDPRGHGLHRAGLRVDAALRPLGPDGTPAHEGLFAAGSILAGQDWIRMKCGAGVAIATAFKAVRTMAPAR